MVGGHAAGACRGAVRRRSRAAGGRAVGWAPAWRGAVKPLLTVEGLRVEFGSEAPPLVAVDGAGLTVHPGEVVGLIGESGSGKSLTCRAVMRLIPRPGRVTAGRIEFDGQDVLGMSARELREFRAHEAGMIYQDPFSSL